MSRVVVERDTDTVCDMVWVAPGVTSTASGPARPDTSMVPTLSHALRQPDIAGGNKHDWTDFPGDGTELGVRFGI